MSEVEVMFPCGSITLEGVWHFPEGRGPFPVVIVCHPHPQYGGNMSSSVVVSICAELNRRSIAALRFNFRGVGESGGNFGEGILEQEDVRAAIDFVLTDKRIDAQKIGLAGYSFGAGVSAAYARSDDRVKAIALVSPVLSDATWAKLRQYLKPKLLIVGDNDSFIPAAYFEAQAKTLPEPVQSLVIRGADHFWWGFEGEMAGKAGRFFGEAF